MNEEELLNNISYWIIEHHKINKNSMFYGISDKNVSSDVLSSVINQLKQNRFEVYETMSNDTQETTESYIKWK